MNHLFLHCRGGFEGECAAEISEQASELGIFGYAKAKAHSACVIFVTNEPEGALQLIDSLAFDRLIFTRQWFVTRGELTQLPVEDRLTPILAATRELPLCSEWLVETVDTNEGKELSGLAKKFSTPLARALEKKNMIQRKGKYCLHLLFTSTGSAYLGVSPKTNRSPWSMGIPRLKLPKESPSRATLKLEEAWHQFIPRDNWDKELQGSMKAVDLGAAPGGWTWLLVQRGMFVEAVDNGPMQHELMETGQVTHHQVDGFQFEPRKPVDWLVCDIVDKPARVAAMIVRWFVQGNCHKAIFNLKLPMKQRYQEVQKLLLRIESECEAAATPVAIRARQLYHDREEITVIARRVSH
ncbi:23S rRNA (cytidine(2498)-2'-O)-methyltransferase RlmM [Simiduia curdlanivorans]|uniref:Ribosomal RNA large subunit methyltransferase M n=1 Tax=Simiduia curdlanivorans TaxID=1492769 RepID=A0ABV8V3W4_9GAMM|nr:23S rRNA (cytidine(2498)-2'-O)-methyltransferase RlmM [Simiduia curdlanivorans]MDN3640167.1 23S rRNA (cytidine(2498)-2'-O)-methyltransferase RlmM [Simiduia curdlanivorans]